MSRVKEIADISGEIIKKLDEAINQTINARLFYEKYKSLLDEAKKIHEQKYALRGLIFGVGWAPETQKHPIRLDRAVAVSSRRLQVG